MFFKSAFVALVAASVINAAPAQESTDSLQPGDVVTATVKYNTVVDSFPFLTVHTRTVVWTMSPTATLPASVTATVTP